MQAIGAALADHPLGLPDEAANLVVRNLRLTEARLDERRGPALGPMSFLAARV